MRQYEFSPRLSRARVDHIRPVGACRSRHRRAHLCRHVMADPVIQARAQPSAHDKSLREDLYRGFIEEASKAYSDALQNNKPDFSSLLGLYSKISRMRVLSSAMVVERADQRRRRDRCWN